MSPMEEHGPGWTTRFTYEDNRQYGALVMATLEAQAPLMLPRGEGDG